MTELFWNRKKNLDKQLKFLEGERSYILLAKKETALWVLEAVIINCSFFSNTFSNGAHFRLLLLDYSKWTGQLEDAVVVRFNR